MDFPPNLPHKIIYRPTKQHSASIAHGLVCYVTNNAVDLSLIGYDLLFAEPINIIALFTRIAWQKFVKIPQRFWVESPQAYES